MLKKIQEAFSSNKSLQKKLQQYNQQELFKLALHDNNKAVRQAAICLINKPEIIELLCTQLVNDEDKQAAAEHWSRLLLYNDSIAEYMAEQYVLGSENQDLLLALLQTNENASLATLAFTGLHSEQHLLELLKYNLSSHLANAIIYKLNKEESLKQAEQICDGDKALLKKIHHKQESLESC